MADRFFKFFFSPASPKPLAALRMGVASTLLIQAVMCVPEFFEWYGTQGFLQGELMDRLSWGLPQASQIIRFFSGYGFSERTTLLSLATLYMVSLVGLLVGRKAQIFSFTAWFIHLILGEGHATGYGLDLFGNISLFYFIWMPSSIKGPATPLTRLSLRVWQIHLSIVYFVSGIEKARGPQWWNGEAIWRSLMLPIYSQFDLGWMASVPWLPLGLGWFTLIVEIGYPFFIFPRKTRMLWVALTVGMHIGIAIFLGLHLFALMMSIFTLCAFGLARD
jgi:hypothetical protein